MSIYGAMFSGVSALFANSQALGMISDNISNVNTIGYKATRSRFATLVTSQANPNSYSPGGVSSKPQSLVDQQGLLQASASGTDIAISGRGFFIVNDSVDATADQATGSFMFTRAGSFSPDSNGYLRNTGGFYLMGWPTNNNGAIDLNGDGLSNSSDTVQRGALVETELRPVKVTSLIGSAAATSSAGIDANLPSTAAVGDQHVVTVQVFDSLGNGNNVNLTFTKSATNEWNITAPPPANAGTLSLTNSAGAVYHASGRLDFTANAAPGETIDIDGTTYSFVAGAPVGNQIQVGANLAATLTNIAAVDARITSDGVSTLNIIQSGTTAMTIDAFTGGLAAKIEQTAGITVSGLMAGTIAPAVVFDGNGVPTSFNVANMSIGGYSSGASNSAIAIDLGNTGGPSGLTQFASSFTVGSITQNGSRFGNFQGALIGEDGIVTAVFDNGETTPIYRLPIGTFPNPNGLNLVSGNAFSATDRAGDFFLNDAGSGSAGAIAAGALEQSGVDLAEEFTNMIIVQRAYSAGTKVITTADEMLDELVRVKR